MKCFWVLFIFFNLLSQEVPPIHNFQSEDYNGENQNWSISQSKDQKIYIANNIGLLEYNGANWKVYPSPNESIIRSVKVIEDTIYTGCFMEFGYWKKDSLGVLNYTSLSKKIKADLIKDEQFWNILNIENWIIFQSLKCIYIYDTTSKDFNIIRSKSSITKTFKIDDTIYFHKNGEGLFKIETGKEILVSSEDILRKDKIVNLFFDNKKLIILTQNNGFYDLEKGILKKSNLLVDNLLSKFSIYSGIQLKNKDFALGTISHGLVYLTKEGQIKFQINQDKGLLNNTILSLYEDLENNIWLGLDNGISYISPNSAYQIYNDKKGILGSVYTAEVYQNYLYLGTNQGLFFKDLNTSKDFVLIKGTQGQVWSLNKIDDTLFCGHDSGTYVIKKGSAKKIASIQGTWAIQKLENHPNLLIQGNYNGLYILEASSNSWKIKNKIEGFDYSSRYFEILDHNLFVNHEYKGVFKLEVDTTFSKIKKITIDTLIKGANSGIIKYNNDLLYAYKKGILKFDTSKQKFKKDPIISKIYTPEKYESGKLVLHKKDNSLWVFSDSKISKIASSSLGNSLKINNIPLPKRKRKGILGYENIIPLNNNKVYLIGTISGYIILNNNLIKEESFNIHIDQILNNDYQNSTLITKDSKGYFKTKQNNLEISYYVPRYNNYLGTYYQYQLEGFYDKWSNWSKQPSIKFKNLPYGDYTFNVRAKIGDAISSNIESYQFTIKKPWYISTIMLVIYILGVLLFSLFMHTVYRKYYKNQQQKLLLENKRELEFTKIQNEREVIKIKNEQLQLENKSKGKELAASTMGIIKKNELLSDIKNELNKVRNKETVRSVIQIIDKNLNQSNDWELFQEAFNNADSEFLKNIKKSHPALTPNDLKLCAYLRLNLSSKEISQLFHISPKSVEIKRYRLRKKLKLEHETNLADYILAL